LKLRREPISVLVELDRRQAEEVHAQAVLVGVGVGAAIGRRRDGAAERAGADAGAVEGAGVAEVDLGRRRRAAAGEFS
jgi:hypothetical protein